MNDDVDFTLMSRELFEKVAKRCNQLEELSTFQNQMIAKRNAQITRLQDEIGRLKVRNDVLMLRNRKLKGMM